MHTEREGKGCFTVFLSFKRFNLSLEHRLHILSSYIFREHNDITRLPVLWRSSNVEHIHSIHVFCIGQKLVFVPCQDGPRLNFAARQQYKHDCTNVIESGRNPKHFLPLTAQFRNMMSVLWNDSETKRENYNCIFVAWNYCNPLLFRYRFNFGNFSTSIFYLKVYEYENNNINKYNIIKKKKNRHIYMHTKT